MRQIKHVIGYMLVTIIVAGGALYLNSAHPEMVKALLLKVDTLGITSVGAKEQKRVARIKSLPIPYEKKQVLIDRTVFMGASNLMVYLALGEPKSTSKAAKVETQPAKVERWVYHFTADKRPTVLEFEDGVLVSAYKASKVDVASANY